MQKGLWRINGERLARRLDELAAFGLNGAGGLDRGFGTKAELAARQYLIGLLEKEIGAAVSIDAAANIWATVGGQSGRPAIAVGSHHDTVPNGGKYDGALGVLLAVEIAQCIKESGLKLRHPFTVVSFTAEEPNVFGLSTFGSRSASGKLRGASLIEAADPDSGLSLSAALARAGGNLAELDSARVEKGAFKAFLECHIEQGARLEKAGAALATVDWITSIYREHVLVEGEPNHAGTTMMPDRHDALMAAAAFGLAFEQAVRGSGREDIVGTIGEFAISPNAVNIIPGQAELTMEIRCIEREKVGEVLADLAAAQKEIEKERGVRVNRRVVLDQPGVWLDGGVTGAMEEVLGKMGEKCLALGSMAGHDAVHMAGLTAAGMLFVRSAGGKSHCPEEHSDIKDMVKAGDVLLNTVLLLDER